MAVAPLAILLLPLLRAGDEARAALRPAVLMLAAAGATAFGVALAAGTLVPSLVRGGRRAVMRAMAVGAVGGVAAVLVLPGAAGLLSARLGISVPEGLFGYAVAAGAVQGLALIVAVHRIVRVGGHGVALVGAAGFAVGAIEALLPAQPTLDDGVVGLLAAAVVFLVGLGSATLAGGPTRGRADVFGVEDAAPPSSTNAGRERASMVDPAVTDQSLGVLVIVALALGLVARVVLGSFGGAAGDDALAGMVGGSFHDAIAGSAGTAHPPLSVALAWWSQHAFGGSGFQWPAYLAGVLLAPAAFAAGRALYGTRTGMVAAAVAAVGPAFVWASAAGGPTTITALLVCLALLALVAALDAGGALRWILFGLSCAAVVWTHQFGVVTVAVLHGAAGFSVVRAFRSDRQERRYGPLGGWGIALAMTLTAGALLVGWQDGLGAASTPPTLEYATNAAPAGGTTPFGLAAGALSTIVGFHPPDVTSRLLALWPLGILAAFALFGRRWSSRGVLLVALAAAPFLALLIADLAGAPRQPPLALEWLAPALPAVALAIGRAVDRLTATQGRTGLVLAAVIAVLVLGTADQTVRVARHPASPSATAAGPTATVPAPTTTSTTRR